MEEGSSASEDQVMVDEDYDSDIVGEEMPKLKLNENHEAKLKELLHKITSNEIKIWSDATKEFIKLLRGDSGGELLYSFVQNSAKCSELLGAWNLRRGKPGMFYILKLISVILGHPDGVYEPNDMGRMRVSRVLDKFARSLIEQQLEDVHKELKSKEAKRQKAALLLLASIVRRGTVLASEVEKKFDFKLEGFCKTEYKRKPNERRMKLSLRKSFVGFAMSFLEVGTPGLLRSVIRQKGMYSRVMCGLGNDDEETVIYVLSTLQNRILVEGSFVPPGLRSVLFGSFTLEQLAHISGRENGGPSSELAYRVLVMVCTDPSNGLMEDSKRHLKGNLKRQMDLMKKLKATEIGYHRDLLLAVVCGRPSLCAAYMEQFPYNLEDYASPNWFSVVTLAANLVSSVGSQPPFGFHDSQAHNGALFDNVDVQDVIKCLYPRQFSRSTINKGLLHSDFLVKHGTLRHLLEALKLLDSFLADLNLRDQNCSGNGTVHVSESLNQEFQNAVRSLLPDPQVLLTLLSSLSSNSRKRTVDLEKFPEHSPKSVKKLKSNFGNKDSDIVVGGISFDPDIASPENSERELTNVMADLWGLDLCSTPITALKDADLYFHSRVLDALRIYLRIMPTGLKGSFEFLMNLLSSPLPLQNNLHRSLLSLLIEYIGWSPRNRTPIRTPPLMYKHLQTLMKVLIFSPLSDIKDQAYCLTQAAMFSTGAFDRNQHEIASWFLFIPCFDRGKSSVEVQGAGALQSLSNAVISFLSDAVSTTGKNLFKYWDNIVKRNTYHLETVTEVSPQAPLILCVLQNCLRLLDSGSGTFTLSKKTMISTYVCNTLKYILKTQVDARFLSSMIFSVLVERLGDCSATQEYGDICEWRPLNSLLLFSQSICDQKICCISSIDNKAKPADSSFALVLEEVERFAKSGSDGEIAGITKAFFSSIICTTPDEILVNFPSVMAISQCLLGLPLSLFSSIFFLEHNLLSIVSKLWPEVFFPGLSMAITNICCKGGKEFSCGSPEHASYTEEAIYNQNFGANEAAASAFSLFLKKAPFHVLFPAIMCIDGPYSLEPSKIQELLLAKLSECATDYLLISYLRLVLFWLYQIRSSCRVEQLVDFLQLSEICSILVENLLYHLLVLKTDSDSPQISRVLLSSHDIQKVAETIFYHPAMIASLSCPLECSEDLSEGNLPDNVDALISLSRQRVHRLDHHALDILATSCEYLFSLCNGHQFTPEVEDGAGKKFVKAFNVLVLKLFQEVKVKFDHSIRSNNFLAFLPKFYALHALSGFISPFELLELARWMFSRVDMDGNQKSAIYFGSCIAGGAFRNLSKYLQQPNTKRKAFDLFWTMEENNINSDILEELYIKISKFSFLLESEVADHCLLEAMNVVYRQKCMQKCTFHPLIIVMSRVIATTPVEMLSHCIYSTSKTKARLLSLLTDVSSMHLSTFGHLFSGILDTGLLHKGNVTCALALSDEDYMMLLPSALSYLNSVLMKFGKSCYMHFRNIPSFYSKIILNGLLHWKNFISRDVFHEEYGEVLPSSAEEFFNLINDSLLGKVVCMLRHHYALNADSIERKDRLEHFSSIFPPSVRHEELIDWDVGGLGSHSLNGTLNSVNKIYAKVSFCRMLLFANGTEVHSLSNEAGENLKGIPLDMGCNGGDSLQMQFLNILVDMWQSIVKRVPSVSLSSHKGHSRDSSSLWRYLEVLILRSIFELSREMHDDLIRVQCIPFLEKLMKPALLHRFEDPTTLQMLCNLLTLLSEGKFSRVPYLQLLLAHSQFVPTIRSLSKTSYSSHVGTFSRPMSSILRSPVFLITIQNENDAKCNLETTELYIKQLAVIKLLRTLLTFKIHLDGFDFGKDLGIDLREVHLLLLSSYGATLTEIDVEIYNLMRTIECIDGLEHIRFAGIDYLWGSASLKIDKERNLEQSLSYDIMNDAEAVKEHRRNQLRENLVIDPKICASTVLYFPYHIVASDELLSLNKFQTDLVEDKDALHSPDVDTKERYNPIFILRFSIHCLSEGYIEPVEFVGLGLLAIAFMSISSPNDRIRSLGYKTLGTFRNALQTCQKRKGVKQISLLFFHVENGIQQIGQRISSVNAIFAAETSLILLDTSHEHYATLVKLLKASSTLNTKNVPLFTKFFWSSSINFRSERLWILRLLYAGLNVDDDAHVYIKNSILETLLSFYVSPLSDEESKELILQVVKKSVKFHKMARHLVEKCGLFPWFSSVLLISSESHRRDETLCLLQLGVVSEVVNDVVSSRNITEWLQNYALEQLTEFTSHLYKFLVSDATLLMDNVAVVNRILEIITSAFKTSQKRTMYQPHFIVSFEGLYRIYKAVKVYDNARSYATVEFGLKTILMSAPPAAIFHVSGEKLSSFIMWAISSAVEADSATILQPKESHQCLTTIPEEKGLYENSLISKLLRWLTATVILGKLDWSSSDLDPKFSKRLNLKSLHFLMAHADKASGERGRNGYGCEEILASAILYLQQLSGTNYEMLPSVAAALSLLLSSVSIFAGFLHDNIIVQSLWLKICCPNEANPAWRWSFYEPWKDPTLEVTDSQKMEELHACESLLVIFSNVLGKRASEFQVSSTQDIDRFGVFEWERRIIGSHKC